MIQTFRAFLRHRTGRLFAGSLAVASFHAFAEPQNYTAVIAAKQAREAEVREIARKMHVDPDFLLDPQARHPFDLHSLFSTVAAKLTGSEVSSDAAQQPLDIRGAIARTKARSALVKADTVLGRLTTLGQLASADPTKKARKKGQIKAEVRALLGSLDADLLPPLAEKLPSVAVARDARLRDSLDDLRKRVKSLLNNPHALDDGNLDATLAQLQTLIGGTLVAARTKPRWTKDPLPLRDVYRTAAKRAPAPVYGATSSSAPAAVSATSSALVTAESAPAGKRLSSNAVPQPVAALGQSLGTPAAALRWVYDGVDWEPYSGVAKGSLGTMQEGRGTDWDQALLLRDLLVAQGYDARLEWGRVTLPIARAMNLTGTEDPLQAANLLATAGFDGVVLTNGGAPVSVQMTHAWVRAYIPYLPDRGARPGNADTWVRMDPSFKRYDYDAGIAINGRVAWSEDEFLRTTAMRTPADFYGDKIWSYIRANNLNCQNLSQVAKRGHIHAAHFPFVPATLTVRIDQTLGITVDPPTEQIQRTTVALRNGNATVVTLPLTLAETWGRKLSLTFAPATADDASIIAANGGLFSTPAYLIQLKPQLSLDDEVVAEGAAVPAGAALDLDLAYQQPNVPADTSHHAVIAGETHTLVFDAGSLPDSLLTSHMQRLRNMQAAGANTDTILSEQLLLVGIRYMQHVDDAIAFASGVRWQRPVKRVFEADVRRQLDVRYTVAGAPLRLVPAENNIDVARLSLGIVPIDNDVTNRRDALSLAGLQSSWLEGQVWEEMQSQQGVSAAKALVLARMAGQQLFTVNSANADSVLATTSLPDDVEEEIRGAVAQGRVAKIAAAPIAVNRWSGSGYILEDPQSGAATYPISGGLAGGSTTGEETDGVRELLGSESWLGGSPLGELLRQLLGMLGGGGGNDGPSTTQADPVNMSTGNMYRSATDVSIVARGLPVALSRTYNSRSAVDGQFGHGWTCNYCEQLLANDDGSMTYREGDGTEHRFAASGSGFVSPAGKHLSLAAAGSGWTLTYKDGIQASFDARGLLIAQRDRNGNVLTIQRDGAGNLSAIVDSTGRTVLMFASTGGRITSVTDLANRVTTYAYDGADLVSVTDTAGKTWAYAYDLDHNMTSAADPLGNTQLYEYDAEDRLMRHLDAAGAEELFHYDIGNRQAVLTDRRGGDRLIVFDDSGRATLESDPAGNIVKASFDADNNRTSVLDSRGNTTTYEYDAAGNTTKQTSPDGGISSTTYDAYSRPLTSTDPLGVVTTNSYDSSGNLLTSSRTVSGVTETTTNTYDEHGQLLTTKDPNGAGSSMTWDANGSLATRTDAAHQTTTITADSLGRITSMKDPAGNETTLAYDGKDRILSMTDPYHNTTSFGYDDAGRRTSVTTPRGTTTYLYDAEGRVLTVTDPLGQRNSTTYDAAGDVVTRVDARGNTTRYEYDLAGRVTKMTDPNGGVWSYGYCASLGGGSGGSWCDLSDPNGAHLKREFDVMGRVVAVTDGLSHTTFTLYDKAGRKTSSTDANGNTTTWGYDEAGRLRSVTEPTGAVTTYTYDRNGNKRTQKDANGHVWTYDYDALNRLKTETDPLQRVTSYTYDALGNLKTRTDANNRTRTFQYDIRRLREIDYPDGSMATFDYDALGRRTSAANANVSYSYAYDALNRITSVTDLTSRFTTSYTYDATGNRATMTTPETKVSYVYDAANRLTQMSSAAFGLFRFDYDAAGARRELRYPNGVTTSYDYDTMHRLMAIVSKDAKGIVLDAWSYGYDAAGNRTSKTDMNGIVESYHYDAGDRLTDANRSDGAQEHYTYDAVGNRMTKTGAAGATITYSYDVANQLLRAGNAVYTYDNNGSMLTRTEPGATTTFEYDGADRTATIAAPFNRTEHNTYGPDGQRVTTSNFGVRVQYELSGNPIADQYLSNLDARDLRLYGPGVDELLAQTQNYGNGSVRYVLHDALGSVTVLTDQAGGVVTRRAAYSPFGETASATDNGLSGVRIGYTGREPSVGGFMNYRSRYYEAGVGRFTQPDEQRGNQYAPQSLNRFAYAFNEPALYVDPSGKAPQYDPGEVIEEWDEGEEPIATVAFSTSLLNQGYMQWNVDYSTYTLTFPTAGGTAVEAAFGYMHFVARSVSDPTRSVEGLTFFTGFAVGLFFFTFSKSSMQGFSDPRSDEYHAFSGPSAYLSVSAFPVGFTFSSIATGWAFGSVDKNSVMKSEWSRSGLAQRSNDLGITVGFGVSVSWN